MNILELNNHPLSAITLHPRKQKVELLYICNLVMVIRLSYLRFVEEESLIFSDPWDLKLNETFITKPTNESHILSELQTFLSKGGGGGGGVGMTPNGFLNITLLRMNQN